VCVCGGVVGCLRRCCCSDGEVGTGTV
jgi:hypothetical protein